MVETPVIPVGIEVALDIGDALLVNAIHMHVRRGFVAYLRKNAADTMFARSVNENMKSIVTAAKNALPAAANENTISHGGGFFERPAAELGHMLAIEGSVAGACGYGFKAAAP